MVKSFIEKNIPDELKRLNNWVCWKAVAERMAHGGISKKPINPKTGEIASVSRQDTWSDFDTAVRVSENYSGIGFMFSNSDYFGIDIDDYAEVEMETFTDFVCGLGSYAELSQSKTGIHIICKGKLPEGSRRKGNIEMYDSGRFFTMTGYIYSKDFDTVTDCTEKIKSIYNNYFHGDN